MKKTKTIATKILVPVFVLVFVFESATSLIGYFAYRKSNEASYSEENGEIVDTFQNYFDNFFVAIASNEYYIDKTIEIYNQNAPEKDYKDLTEDEKIAYYNLFYKDVGSHVADDGINYF